MKGIYIYDTPTYYVLLSTVRWTFFRPSKTRFPFLYLLQAFITRSRLIETGYYIIYSRFAKLQYYLKYQRWILQNYIYFPNERIYIYFNNFFPCPIFSRFFYTSDPRFILLARTAINANRSIRARRHLDVVVVDVIAFFTMSRLVAYTQRSRDQTSTRSFPTSRTYPQSSTASGIIISIFPGGRRFEANETKWNESEAIALRCWRRGRGRGGGLS